MDKCLAHDLKAMRNVSKELLKNQEFIFAQFQKHPSFFPYLPQDLQNKLDFLNRALANGIPEAWAIIDKTIHFESAARHREVLGYYEMAHQTDTI